MPASPPKHRHSSSLGATLLMSPSTSSVGSSPVAKRFRFRRHSTSSTAVHPANNTFLQQCSMEDSSSTQSTSSSSTRRKRRSIISRLLHRGGTRPQHQLYNNNTMKQQEERNDCPPTERDESHHDEDPVALARVYEEASNLLERGLQERNTDKLEEALATWSDALALVSTTRESTSGSSLELLTNQILCRLISLRFFLHHQSNETSTRQHHMDEATALMAQLQVPWNDETNYASYLVEGLVLEDETATRTVEHFFELLMKQSQWFVALQVAHKLPSTSSLTLARLHLETAMGYGDDSSSDASAKRKRQQKQLSHLSECHQLLLSLHPVDHCKKDQVDTYECLWQLLARAYGMLGEEELALGCSGSRMQHISSPKELVLAHYQQAMDVYVPVGQYTLAIQEADLALEALGHVGPCSKRNVAAIDATASSFHKEHKGEEESVECELDDIGDTELLANKLYEFKADVLCRMGRISDSIQNYEILLEAYRSSRHYGPVEVANLLYILGKLSVRARNYSQALDYFHQELQMTQSVVGSSHLAISKIYHELARVADAGLMDYPLAVKYYQEALQVESQVYQQCKVKQKQILDKSNASLLQDAKVQMGETKQCLGKLHFKMGDFNRAMRTTLA